MTPRQLRYFTEIARLGSISTASSTLRIAQPALSQHVAAMEEELGVRLFERHARGVRLTAEGRRLVDRAGSILAQLDGLKSEMHAPSGRPSGSVRLCIAGALAVVLAAPLYRRMDRDFPEVRLLLSTAMSTEARTIVEARQVDLAVMPNAFELPGLTATPLYEKSFSLFGLASLFEKTGRKRADADAAGPIRFSDIGTRPLVAADRDHDLRRLIERTALTLGCPLNVRYELNSPELSLALVRDGLAFAVMPQSVQFEPGGRGGRRVLAREIIKPRMTRVQAIVSVADQRLTSAGEAVRASIKAVVADLIERNTLKGKLIEDGSIEKKL